MGTGRDELERAVRRNPAPWPPPEEKQARRWYRNPLAWLAAAVIVVVAVVDGLQYRSNHVRQAHLASAATATARALALASATAAARAQATSTAEARREEATAVAVQTAVPRAVAMLRSRVTATAIAAAHAQATSGALAQLTATVRAQQMATAAAQQTAGAQARAAAAARARETSLAASGNGAARGSSSSAHWIVRAGSGGERVLLDAGSGIGVVAGTPQTGRTDQAGAAPPGSTYLWIATVVSNGGTASVPTGPSDFTLQGADGHAYTAGSFGPPPGYTTLGGLSAMSLAPHEIDTGTIAFQIPAGSATYTLLWQEAGAAPHAICHVQVTSSGQAVLQP